MLSIYFPDIFIPVFTHQDFFSEQILEDYQPESTGIELFLRNNFLLLKIKEELAPKLTNDEFVYMLYEIFDVGETGEFYTSGDESEPIQALEVQHYQTLIHKNFNRLFKGKLTYYDEERQNARNGMFDTQEIGVMDFLAIDEKGDFVVIELKRKSTDVTLGQILRYMGWVKENLCKDGQQVKGLIIAESKDNRLEYALSVTPNVEFRKMKLFVEIE